MPEGRPWDYDEDVTDSKDDGGLWQQASAAVAKVLGPNLGMRAANPFAPGVSSQGTESITSYGDDPRAAGYAGDAAAATAVNAGLASAMGVGGMLQAGPIAAAKVLGGGYVGGKAGETVGDVVGAPGAGKVIGSLVGGGLGAAASPATVATAMSEMGVGGIGGRIAAETLRQAPKAARVASQAAEVAAARASTAAPAAASAVPAALPKLNPVEIQNYVMTMRQQHGLSGAQITGFLRSKFGIPIKDGSKMVRMILESQ